MPLAGSDQPSRHFSVWALPASATLVYLFLRLPGLMDLPIFCDESIYLRYGQLIRRSPFANAFVSLIDPKPPLHYWLLASVFGLTSDPLRAARLLSVVAGLASVLLLIPLCHELRELSRHGDRKDGFSAIACLLFLTCPFLAFYQRLALAESLLVLESLGIAWLSLRLTRDVAPGAPAGVTLRESLALGLAMGLALLTKQNYSYALMALPLAAAVLRWKDLAAPGRRRTLARGLAVSFALAMLLFSPVLLVPGTTGLRDRLFFRASHGAFAGGVALHARLSWENFRYVFLPTVIPQTNPGALYEGFGSPADAGWLWIYLTPPINLLCLAGFAAFLWKSEIRQMAFLGIWALLMLLPFVPFATTAVSRYALLAVPPLLLAGAGLLDELWEGAWPRRRALLRAVLFFALLVWPLYAIAIQDLDYRKQAFTRSDRWQHVSGWPAGSASRRAVDWISERASRGPVVVITSNMPGTPNDVIWTYLEGRRNVFLFFVTRAFQEPILRHVQADTFSLLSGFHRPVATVDRVRIRQDVPIFFIGMDPFPSPRVPKPAESLLRPRNPELAEVARFENPSMESIPHRDAVVIYRIR